MYRISELLQVDRKIFHTNDLAILWGIANKSTLYVTISRNLNRGVLFPVYKGLYSTVPVDRLDPLELGRAIIHRFTYLTTETVLFQAGILSQIVHDYTFVADRPWRVSIGRWSFRFRKLKDDFLHNPVGITTQPGGFAATIERATADLLYYNPRYHFDVPELIDFEKVKSLQEEIGYPC